MARHAFDLHMGFREGRANPEHSVDEPRFLVVGYSFRQNLLVVAHSEIDDTIRIISARRATTHERQDYEEG